MRTQNVLITIAALCLTLNSPALATDRLVPSQYPTIQAGIDAAEAGDTVIVADGTYTGSGNRDIDFKGKAITVRSQNGPDSCIIDCQGSSSNPHRGFYFHNSEGPDSIVSGLRIINGYVYNANGGGIYCIGSSPTIEKCVITGNRVQGRDGMYHGDNGVSVYGGGVYCSSSNAMIIGCRISNNTVSGGNGGDGWCPISGCIDGGNGGHARGGGIYGSTDSYLKIEHCTITGNIVSGGTGGFGNGGADGLGGAGHGGGIYGKVAVANTVVMENEAASFLAGYGGFGGGGYFLQNSSVFNCLIAGNSACCENSSGGGIYGSDITVVNCTICNNTILESPGGIYCGGAVTIVNCIIRSNDMAEITGSPIVTYSDIQGGWPGEGNIDADPFFVSEQEGDYYLSQIASGQMVDSPCVDAGSDLAANLGMDICSTRTDEVGDIDIVDMGYHYFILNPADISGEGDVDFFDYAIFASQWKQMPGVPSADLAPPGGDGKVDEKDLAFLIKYWLWGK